MPRTDLPEEFIGSADKSKVWIERGGSAIIGPDSRYLVEPIFEREELIIADLDLNEIDKESMTLDVTGHYARPDVFKFEVKGQ